MYRAGTLVFSLRLEQRDQPLDDLFKRLLGFHTHCTSPGMSRQGIDASTFNVAAMAIEHDRRTPSNLFSVCIKSRQGHGARRADRRARSHPGRAASNFARDNWFAEWNLLRCSHERSIVRVVTIKHPPAALEGLPPDNSMVGKIYDLPPQLAILMIAAGWVRSDTRSRIRRHRDQSPGINRRERSDRRSAAA